jgi:hypothetical protein
MRTHLAAGVRGNGAIGAQWNCLSENNMTARKGVAYGNIRFSGAERTQTEYNIRRSRLAAPDFATVSIRNSL